MKNYVKFASLVVLFASLPLSTFAASFYVESSRAEVSVGDTVIISAKINAEGSVINTVEGNIVLKSGGDSVAIKEFSLANSAFGLWPRTPSLSLDTQTVSFTGGVPGGFSIEGATVFKIIFEAKKEGTVVIEPRDIIAYANDGNGTRLSVSMNSFTLKVVPQKAGVAANNEWGSIVDGDKIAPEDFIIVLGQDSTLFDGKKFAFFSALDNQSGISHYEVSENSAPAVRSGSTYVLQNQTEDVTLSVTAFDKAGNKKVALYSPAAPEMKSTSMIAGGIVALLVLVIAILLSVKLRGGKKNVSEPIQ